MLFFQLPNHSSTSFSSCLRASETRPSTSEVESALLGFEEVPGDRGQNRVQPQRAESHPIRREVLEVGCRGVPELTATHQKRTPIDDELGRTALFAQVRERRRLGGENYVTDRDGEPEDERTRNTKQAGAADRRIHTGVAWAYRNREWRQFPSRFYGSAILGACARFAVRRRSRSRQRGTGNRAP